MLNFPYRSNLVRGELMGHHSYTLVCFNSDVMQKKHSGLAEWGKATLAPYDAAHDAAHDATYDAAS